jgi:PAS domain-containing protein
MKPLLDTLNTHLGLIAGIIGSLLVIVPAVREWLWRAVKGVIFLFRAPFIIQGLVERLVRRADEADQWRKGMDERFTGLTNAVGAIKHELSFNGSNSTKDFLKRMEEHRRHDLWTKGAPVLELDAAGNVTLVSQAACKLFGVSSESDLKRLNWLRFLDGGEVGEFIEAFRSMAATGSGFNFRIGVVAEDGESRGEWDFRAVLIGPRDASAVYSALFLPADDLAKSFAGRHRWAC